MKSNNNIYIIQYTIYETDISKIKNYINGNVENATDDTYVSIKNVPAGVSRGMVSKISGKTVKFNQIILDQTRATTKYDNDNITVTTSDHHTITVDKNPVNLTAPSLGAINFTQNHIYYVSGCPDGGGSNSYSIDCPGIFECNNAMGSRFTSPSTTTTSARLRLSPNTTWTNKTFKPQLYDLTVMFGSGKEPTLEQCTSLFSGINSTYNVGTLWSSPVGSVVSRGLSFASLDDFGVCETIKSGTRYGFEYTNLTAGTYTVKLTTMGASRYYIAKNSNGTVTDAINSVLNDTGIYKYALANGEGLTIYTLDSEALSKSCMHNLMVYKGNVSDFIPPSKTTVLVPSSIKNLPDYGLGIVRPDGTIVVNEVDFENGVYHRRVSKFNLDVVLSGGLIPDSSNYRWYTASAITPAPKVSGLSGLVFLSGKYTPDEAVVRTTVTAPNMTACFYVDKKFYFIDNSATTTTDARDKVKDVEVVYELAQEEMHPLSDFIRPFPVENGGTVTLASEHGLDIPNVIKYKKEV